MSDKLNIEALTSNNRYKWQDQMQVHLEGKELWVVVQDGDGAKVQEEIDKGNDKAKAALAVKDALARSLLMQTVDESIYPVIRGVKSAHGMWKNLKERFQYESAAVQRSAQQEWRGLVYTNTNISICDYISKFDMLAERYIAAGGALKESDKIIQLLDSIESKRFSTITESTMIMELSYKEVCRHLRMHKDAVIRRNNMNGNGNGSGYDYDGNTVESALAVTQRGSGKNYGSGSGYGYTNRNWRGNSNGNSTQQYKGGRRDNNPLQQRQPVVCYVCEGKGHRAFECPSRGRVPDIRRNMNMNGRNDYRRGNESSHVAYNHGNSSERNDSDDGENVLVMHKSNEISGWLIDSGASHHITHDKSMLSNYRNIDHQVINGFSKNSMDYAIGEGEVKIPVIVNGQVKPIRVTSVWYVPGAQKNLISVSALMEKGCKLVFSDSSCEVWLNGMQKLKATLRNKLFEINTADTHTPMIMSAHDGIRSSGSAGGMNLQVTSLWHQRMGHASEKVLESMMTQGAVIGMDKAIVSNASICEGCIMGKHTREPFRSHVEGRSVEVLQLVHTDVGESDIASWSGKKYYVTFIDDYSRCVWVYVIDKKSEVYDVFMKWKVLVKNQTQHTIKAIR